MKRRIRVQNLDPQQAIRNGAVEKGIVALVQAINDVAGCKTIASCHGHGRDQFCAIPGKIDQEPYVLFYAEQEFARVLSGQLYTVNSCGSLLCYHWSLGSYFYPPEHSMMVWRISPSDRRLPGGWKRRSIDADLELLADIVQQVASK